MDRFTVLAETCARFSSDVYRRAGTPIEANVEGTIERNLRIARSVFGNQSLETLAVIYLHDLVGFEELKSAIGPISFTFLRGKLRQLEKGGFIQRDDANKDSAGARYSLTHKGNMIARLGEPVFLYLRLADGWGTSSPADSDEP